MAEARGSVLNLLAENSTTHKFVFFSEAGLRERFEETFLI